MGPSFTWSFVFWILYIFWLLILYWRFSCKLILYPVNLLKLLIISGSFLVGFLKSCMFNMSSANNDSLTSFPIYISLISFSCPIVPASVLSTMLKSSGANGYPCLVPDFNRIASCFPPFGMMLALGFSYKAFTIEVCSLQSYSLQDFYHKGMLDLVNGFICIYWNEYMIFVFYFMCVIYYIYWLAYIESSLHLRNKTNLFIVDNLFWCIFIQF